LRENAAAKARRLLAEGRVTITRVDGREIAALVRGDSAQTYRVFHRDGAWVDDCPARTAGCSHITAVKLITNLTPWRSASDLFSDEWARESVAPWEATAPPRTGWGDRG
jgi:uncharacterized Zn finger protein